MILESHQSQDHVHLSNRTRASVVLPEAQELEGLGRGEPQQPQCNPGSRSQRQDSEMCLIATEELRKK